MFDISPTIALAVFVSAFVLDFLYARYTYYIISMKAEMAATVSFVWHMLSASVIVQYAENSAYILFMCLGGTLGTYLTVWQRRRAAQSAGWKPSLNRRAYAPLTAPATAGSARKHSAWSGNPGTRGLVRSESRQGRADPF